MSFLLSDDLLLPPSAFQFESNNDNKNNIIQSLKYTCENFTQTKPKKYSTASSNTMIDVKNLDEVKCIIEKEIKIKESEMKSNYDKIQYEQSEVKKENELLRSQLSEYEHQIISLKNDLDKMKLYTTGVANREEWINEKQKLLSELKSLKSQNNELESLLQSEKRQKCNIEKLLSIQETELIEESKKKVISITDKESNKIERLLYGWRQKVLSLLVQQESMKLQMDREQQLYRNDREQWDDILKQRHFEKEKIILQLENLEQQNKTNQLTIECIKQENSHLKQNNQSLKQDYSINMELLNNILEHCYGFCRKMEESIIEKYSNFINRIDQLEHRIEFALSRFPIIHVNIVRKLNLAPKQLLLEQTTENTMDAQRNNFNSNKIAQLEEALILLKKELDTIKLERDKLISTIQFDSQTFQDRINEKKTEIDSEMQYLKERVQELEVEVSKSYKMKDVIEKENERLKDDLKECRMEKMSEREKQIMESSGFEEEIRKLNSQISQLKRKYSRDKEEFESKIEAYNRELSNNEVKWQEICEQLRVENNMLKVTLRQQDILQELNNVSEKIVPSITNDNKEGGSKNYHTELDDKKKHLLDEINQLAQVINQ